MKSSFCIDLQRFMLIPTKFPLILVDGAFKGVVGKVARWQGQQRVGVVVDDLVTVVTAYVPSAFLEKFI